MGRRPGSAEVAATAGVALGVVVLVEVVRVWAPALMLIHGEVAGIPDPIRIALAAVVTFVVVAVVAPTAQAALATRPPPEPRDPRRVRLARAHVDTTTRSAVLVGSALVLVTARLAVQVTSRVGGDAHMLAVTLALVAGLVWLASVAADVDRRAAAIGIVAGLGLDGVLHALLATVPLTWHEGPAGWVAVAALLVGFVAATGATRTPTSAAAARPAWVFLVVPLVLALHGVFGGVAHLQATSGLDAAVVAAVVAGAHVVAVLGAASLVAAPSRGVAAAGGGLVVLGVAAILSPGMPFETPAVAAVAHAVLVVGLGLAVATVGATAGAASAVARSAVTSSGMLLFLAVVFGYYASYDLPLPFPREAFLVVAALGVAALAALARPAPPAAAARVGPGPVLAVVLGLAALLTVAVVAQRPPLPEPVAGDGLPVRVGLYNLHFGYDTSGRLAIDDLAAVIASLDADIVGLQEVDRGWLVTGSIDVLPLLADRLGMHYVFGPAADGVWGNAILSRHPILDAWNDPLPRGGATMERGALTAIVDIGGREIAVVSTHLAAADDETDARAVQAARVAAIARGLVQGGLPVVVVGDFNAPPRARELEALRAVLADATAALGSPPTWPSWDPREPIDHVYVSSDLRATELAVPRSLASDHLAVAVTIHRID